MKTLKLLFLSLIGLLVINSCKKESKDEVDPNLRYYIIINDAQYTSDYVTNIDNFLFNGGETFVWGPLSADENIRQLDSEISLTSEINSIDFSFEVSNMWDLFIAYEGTILPSDLLPEIVNIFTIYRYDTETSSPSFGLKLNDKNIEIIEIGGNGGNADKPCLEGIWYNNACGNNEGVIWTFDTNTGSFSNQDCNGICDPIRFTFSYTISGGNTCNIIYDAKQPSVSCTGFDPLSPESPDPESFTFTCDETSLTVTSGNGTTTFTRKVSDGGNTNTGNVTFWTDKDLGCGKIYVKIDSYGTGVINSYFATNPGCGTSNCANFTDLPYGTYSYTATSDGGCTWSNGSITVDESCETMKLTLNSGGDSKIGNITFWIKSELDCGNIDVTIDSYGTGTINSYYSTNPGCGASGCANFTDLPYGTYSFKATSAGDCVWSGNIELKGGCSMMEFTVSNKSTH